MDESQEILKWPFGNYAEEAPVSAVLLLLHINTDNALLLSDLGTSSQISSKLILNFTCLVKKWWPVWEKCLGSGFTAATPRRVKMCLRWKLKCCVLQTLFVRVKHFICSPIILSTLNWCKKRKVGQRCKFSDKGNNYPSKCCRAAGLLQAMCCRCRSLQQHLITITRAEQAT